MLKNASLWLSFSPSVIGKSTLLYLLGGLDRQVPNPVFYESVAKNIQALSPVSTHMFVPLSSIQQVNSVLNIVEIFPKSIASIAL
jgi:ABC-type lipoprotein export system ATPase subunit